MQNRCSGRPFIESDGNLLRYCLCFNRKIFVNPSSKTDIQKNYNIKFMSESLRLTKLFNINEDCRWLPKDTSYVGIDFGTSTTVVSIATYNPQSKEIDCRSLLLPQKDQYGADMYGELFPTVIAQNITTNKPIYGQGAYDLKWHPDYTFKVNLWHSFKMELGKDLGPCWHDSLQSKIKSPQDATKQFFKFLKRSMEKAINEEGLPSNIKYAVSIPASFESNQRKDLMNALTENDIIVNGSLFIDEPNAAFLGYINSNETAPLELNNEYNPKVLVFDFGAGTCDISILELTIDHNGMHSNNLSISQFAELGGNDIDRYVANNILLPQLLKANHMDGKNDVLTNKEKEAIANQLLGTAENMKKRLCNEDFNYLLSDPQVLDDFVAEGRGITIDTPDLSISTNYGTLSIDKLWLSYADFIHTMNIFFKTPLGGSLGSYTVKGHQKRYNSIQSAINTALAKAHIDHGEIDYVIMIGGSSKNPFVQQRIKQIFSDATVMVPRELQALVSQGAALHSILTHGMNIQAVRPIVGEPIIVISQDGNVTVIEAGTVVPFEAQIGNVFTTGTKSFREIEIPVCVGCDTKILYNLKLRRKNGEDFPENTPVKLFFVMDNDKILHVQAESLGETWEAICENPLDNAAMTTGEAKILKAQRASYVSAVNNGNKPTPQALENLSRAYEDNDQEFLAAETLEEKIQYYPDNSIYNRIGVLFGNSGNKNKAIKYYRLALKEDPNNAIILTNLGNNLYQIGELNEARAILEKAIELKGDYAIAVYLLAKIEETEDNSKRAQELFQRAYNIFKQKWDVKDLNDCHKGWFITVARKLGKFEIANTLQKELDLNTQSRGYSLENTLFGTTNINKS